MSKTERTITVVLPDGSERDYYPTHTPVSQQNGSTLTFAWEQETGEVFSLAVNGEVIPVLEMVTDREEQDAELLALIDKAKAWEQEGGE